MLDLTFVIISKTSVTNVSFFETIAANFNFNNLDLFDR